MQNGCDFLLPKFRLAAVIELFVLVLLTPLEWLAPSSEIAYAQVQETGKSESNTSTPKELNQLYAQSACLLDGDSGRVLFQKNGYDKKANASTTKILTCIVTLENGNLDDVVTISKNAAKQPDVQLNAQSGEQFKLKNLLLSLMLESHNDSAVAIAEHIGGSVEGFAAMMNQKAMDIGCTQSHFVTPNGLDGTDNKGEHGTTAVELAKIMRYCVKESPKAKEFLEITRTPAASFANEAGSRTFSVVNHNRFLSMMEGVLSGKTGFTNKAGYCYVCALERGGRTFIVSLLGCGWPNHKTYKWFDTQKLMQYGIDNYQYAEVLEKDKTFPPVFVENGIPQSENLSEDAYVPLAIDFENDSALSVLLKSDEAVNVVYKVPEMLEAPVDAGEVVGKITYQLGDEVLREYNIYVTEPVEKLSFGWCLRKIFNRFLCGVTQY